MRSARNLVQNVSVALLMAMTAFVLNTSDVQAGQALGIEAILKGPGGEIIVVAHPVRVHRSLVAPLNVKQIRVYMGTPGKFIEKRVSSGWLGDNGAHASASLRLDDGNLLYVVFGGTERPMLQLTSGKQIPLQKVTADPALRYVYPYVDPQSLMLPKNIKVLNQ